MKNEWQPIETAPKSNDTFVVLFGEAAGEISGPSGVQSYLGAGCYSGPGDFDGFNWMLDPGDAYAVWAKPTHWMPLPEPPEAA